METFRRRILSGSIVVVLESSSDFACRRQASPFQSQYQAESPQYGKQRRHRRVFPGLEPVDDLPNFARFPGKLGLAHSQGFTLRSQLAT